jgi:hypothetical protein
MHFFTRQRQLECQTHNTVQEQVLYGMKEIPSFQGQAEKIIEKK